MKSVFALVALAAAAVQPALAHYRFPKLIDSSGAVTGEYVYVRSNTNINSPLTDVTSTDIRCNAGGLTSGSKTSISNVAAGSTVGFQADIPLTHPGPLSVYLGKVPSGQTAATWDGSGANWFKIHQIGADFKTGALAWPTDNAQTFKFKIPSSVPSGQYLLRVEHVALHGASTVGGAQFYISCAQINVTGGGSGNPSKVSIPGAYSATDPSVLINIYWPPVTSYTPPGPAVWSG
ncbi:putative endo-beta-1,4-glucanase D OS=Aspergillus niger (strain CBS 513,88 / FGSC A1513) GN=eglD PE=3 SV=1 [Rhizoctonia solani AG-1 IB]|uniref:lytic cellulose monooxygenase (C4-dehydrogenating) n=1 Tax=Thanatephorus cucumeris (strain AG1-IB / isolate 7/3/14) TaxID=1108050 RepID=A0A0B7FLI8_THACB|nr:putative endo-beta-1,4-glucanase D OS=Aspergillus niger (strain CBS 513,88 / FGSC A1513) GN=eglD PE=3 SV=1 [Rhizoctonia solani AG-1 IB]